MYEEILDHFRISDRALADAVARVLAEHGVPTDLDAVDATTEALILDVVEQRRYLHSAEAEIIRAESPGAVVVVPPPRFYPLKSLHTVIRQSAGLTPRPNRMLLETFDPVTRAMETSRVAPWTAPNEPEVLEEYARRLEAYISQHIKSAARDLTLDVAAESGAKWARRLSGSENCTFCALQASRGAVFHSGNVFFDAHPNCDCYAVLVEPDAAEWEGKEETDRLAELWQESGQDMKQFKQLLEKGQDVELSA